jgi:tetratricopeptide (TPR) repeat protein
MTRIDHNDATAPASLVGWKERGSSHFQRGDYEAALNAYKQALRPDLECPSSEQQLLLSNIVACRLKIGGRAQAEAAVEAAKQCVALNESWAKGHIRLASAYIALGDHSNDACNALQRALQLDPRHPTARDMLVRELRRDRANNGRAAAETSSSPASPSAPPADLDDHDYAPQREFQSQQRQTHQHNDDPYNIDDDISWQDRAQFYLQRAKFWYMNQSADVKAVLKVFFVLIVLYVAFGGRFGLEYFGSRSDRHLHPQSGNAYDEFYQQRRTSHDYHSRDRYDPYAGRYHDPHDNSGSPHHHHGRRSHSWSFGGDNASTLLILAGVAYLAHRNGINPFQALFFANMAMGGRGRGMGRNRGMFGGGYGRGGMMGGMGGFRHPGGRPRW